jgi:hypothetical protein
VQENTVAHRPGTLVAALAIVAGGLAASEPVHGQGLFDLLNGIFRGAMRQYRDEPRAYREEPRRLLEGFAGLPGEERERMSPSSGGPTAAYCVRLCDGRYFPLPANAGAPAMTPAKLCSALCPSAKTRIFTGSEIDHATDERGRSYAKLENAFLYRDRLVADCTCTGRDPTGIARIDPLADPTLRPGDIVVTADGPVVFKGDRQTPHRTSDFVPAHRHAGTPKSLRNQLSDMRIAPNLGTATVLSDTQEPPGERPALSLAPGDNSKGTANR